MGGTASDPSVIRVLFSAAWQRNIEVDDLADPGIAVHLAHRSVDYDLTGVQRIWTYLRDSARVVWLARSYDITVVSSAGFESFIAPLLWLLVPPRVRRGRSLVILDPLPLRWRRLDRLFALGMRHVALVLCIRSGDVGTFGRRFGVPPERCRFIAMPVPVLAEPTTSSKAPDGRHHPEYVYAAGSAHRDWPLLLRAFEQLPQYRCILATQTLDASTVSVPANVELLPAQTLDDGRQLMRQATLVAVTFQDTDLACGPTVVLDAYAMGLPVISSDTNACRDYIRHGATGLLSPPGDAGTLAGNIAALMDDGERREQMRKAINELARGDLSRATFENTLCHVLRDLHQRATRGTAGLPDTR